MKRFISFGSIGKFGDVIKDVKHKASYKGYDEEKKEVIYDRFAVMPTLKVVASEKIHGTNAAVCYSNPDGFWVQSRKNIINSEKDNAGCAFVAEQNQESWMEIIKNLAEQHDIDLDNNIISVFFEWAGGNIQKNSACSGMDKLAIIFQHFKVSPLEPQTGDDGKELSAYWLETKVEDALCEGEIGIGFVDRPFSNIYNIMNFTTWEFDVDFSAPMLSQNKFIDLVLKTVEPDSPLAKQMGISGNIGEGVVCTLSYKGDVHKFKVKGEKHSASKVKTLKPVDNEKEQAKIDVAKKVTPAWRLEQMYNELFDVINGGKGDIRKMGDFLKAVNKDILKEDTDVIAEASLIPKDIFGHVNNISKNWFKEQLDREVGLV